MKINHLLVGASNTRKTARFYCETLNYKEAGEFVDTGTGQTGIVLTQTSAPTLLIVPFRSERLPSPQHIAFEVDGPTFDRILERCREFKIFVRGEPKLDSKQSGPSDHEELGVRYLHFYFCDPSNLNIEIMRRSLPV